MKKSVSAGNRFEDDAGKYAAYLESSEGRLRADLTFANLMDFLPGPPGARTLRALDIGCGPGTAAVRLARLGIHVTLLDSSPAMLALAEQAIHKAQLSGHAALQLGDALHLVEIFPDQSFDLVLCHNLLEYADDPAAVLRGAARVMRHASARLSVLVRNQAGEVLKAALQAGDLEAAERNLSAEWGHESLYSGRVRFFTPEAMEASLKNASLTISARRGVRVIADYLPAQISRSEEYERIFALERKLGERREFFGVARYLHYSASRESPGWGQNG